MVAGAECTIVQLMNLLNSMADSTRGAFETVGVRGRLALIVPSAGLRLQLQRQGQRSIIRLIFAAGLWRSDPS